MYLHYNLLDKCVKIAKIKTLSRFINMSNRFGVVDVEGQKQREMVSVI